MCDVTQILNAVEAGEPQAASQLLPLVYDELRKLAAAQMAHEKPGQTLDATALVHEAYIRLVGKPGASATGGIEPPRPAATGAPGSPTFANRRHFFAAAAEAMRRVLVESARRKRSQKHGGEFDRRNADPDHFPVANAPDPLELLAVHELLDRLAQNSPRKAELVKLRYFLGCTIVEAAEVLGIAPATAEEDWTYAKAWLRRHWLRGEQKV